MQTTTVKQKSFQQVAEAYGLVEEGEKFTSAHLENFVVNLKKLLDELEEMGKQQEADGSPCP